MVSLLELLKDYQTHLKANDGSAECFARLFKNGVELLDLDDEEVARRFSASRPTASRWRRGKSVPVPALRRQVLLELHRAVTARIKRFRKRAESIGGYEPMPLSVATA